MPVRKNSVLLYISLSAALAAMTLAIVIPIPYADSVAAAWRWDRLWRDELWKQISGFTLLGLLTIALTLPLRKRWTLLKWGKFSLWQSFHAVLGALTLAVLLAHTGARLGNGLNFLLAVSLLGFILTGAAIGIVAAQGFLHATWTKRLRPPTLWAHVLCLAPLPVLLAFHILKSYYF